MGILRYEHNCKQGNSLSEKHCTGPLIGPNQDAALDTLEITSEFCSEKLEFDKNGRSTETNLRRRSRSKFFSNYLAIKLASLDSPFKDKYWDTYHCSDIIQVDGEKAKAKFCKKRWCVICNRIRTAQLMQTYYPVLESWPDKQFVTLTVVSPGLSELKETIEQMYKAFTEIKDSERKAGRKLVGLRKLEVTYNRFEDTYHPHFHLITATGESCQHIIDKWLKKFPTAKRGAQNSKPADNHSCFELFKYFTKLTSNSNKDKQVTVEALDNIFRSLEGVRVFQPFGFVAPKKEPAPEEISLTKEQEGVLNIMEYRYLNELHDWINLDSGDFLTGFRPSKRDQETRSNIKHLKIRLLDEKVDSS